MREERIYCDLCGADMTCGMCAKVRLPMIDKNTGIPRLKEIEICFDCGSKIARKIEEYALKGIEK